MTDRELETALCQENRDITRIEIEIVGPNKFRWTLLDGDLKVFTATGDCGEISAMIVCSEILVNSMLGVPPSRERCRPSLN